MILPFSERKKAFWNLLENRKRVDWAIEERNPQHFEQEIRSLYPRLSRHGLRMPLVDPVSIGEQQYDCTWHDFHRTFLKALRRQMRDETFYIDHWNSDVDRESEKRQDHVDRHRRRSEEK